MGEAQLERLVRGWQRGPGVDSRDEGKHTGRNDLLFVKKMWVDEREWPKTKSECCEEAELWWGWGCTDMKVGWLSELCRWVRGACIQCAHLSLATVETGGCWRCPHTWKIKKREQNKKKTWKNVFLHLWATPLYKYQICRTHCLNANKNTPNSIHITVIYTSKT